MTPTKTEQLRKLLADCNGGTLIHIEASWVQDILAVMDAVEKAIMDTAHKAECVSIAGLKCVCWQKGVNEALRKWNRDE